MMYWFPKHALTGKQPVSSVYSLLRGYTVMKTGLDGASMGLGAVVGSAGGDKGVGSLGLVNITFWRCWARCPKIVLLASGQYYATLEYVRPLKVSQFPALLVSNHVCLTGKPRQGVEGNHDVLVPQACSDWKAASVICVQPAEGVHRDEDLIGWHIHVTRGSGRECWR
jgi:hypothetical protein